MTTVKGKAPRKPPRTDQGRWALERFEKHVEGLTNELNGLSGCVLKGLAFEAHRMGTIASEALWRGVADEAIRAAHRTGKGEWYAVVEVARNLRDWPHAWEHVAVVHRSAPVGTKRSRPGRG